MHERPLNHQTHSTETSTPNTEQYIHIHIHKLSLDPSYHTHQAARLALQPTYFPLSWEWPPWAKDFVTSQVYSILRVILGTLEMQPLVLISPQSSSHGIVPASRYNACKPPGSSSTGGRYNPEFQCSTDTSYSFCSPLSPLPRQLRRPANTPRGPSPPRAPSSQPPSSKVTLPSKPNQLKVRTSTSASFQDKTPTLTVTPLSTSSRFLARSPFVGPWEPPIPARATQYMTSRIQTHLLDHLPMKVVYSRASGRWD